RLYLRHQVVVEHVTQVLGVDEDDALIGDTHCGVAAGARHHVEPRFDLLDRLGLSLRRLAAAPSAPLPAALPTALAVLSLPVHGERRRQYHRRNYFAPSLSQHGASPKMR